jgi:uncharacterized membrane protein (DUF373 family)
MTQETKEVHKVLVPGRWVERIEEVFHIVLGVCLLGIAIAALYFSVARVFETSPFFPTGMIQSINDILFIIIILEILRTVVAPAKTLEIGSRGFESPILRQEKTPPVLLFFVSLIVWI